MRIRRSLICLLAVIVALAAVAGICGSTNSARDSSFACTPYHNSLPTAIPTAQWTPEWLSQWSGQQERAWAGHVHDDAQRLVDAHTSVAHMPRHADLADVIGPDPTDKAAADATNVVVGRVTDQHLIDDGKFFDLESTVSTPSGSAHLRQYAPVDCIDGMVTIMHPDAFPFLEAGETYAVLVTGASDASMVEPWYVFVVGQHDALVPLSGDLGRGKTPQTVGELRAAFAAAHPR